MADSTKWNFIILFFFHRLSVRTCWICFCWLRWIHVAFSDLNFQKNRNIVNVHNETSHDTFNELCEKVLKLYNNDRFWVVFCALKKKVNSTFNSKKSFRWKCHVGWTNQKVYSKEVIAFPSIVKCNVLRRMLNKSFWYFEIYIHWITLSWTMKNTNFESIQ